MPDRDTGSLGVGTDLVFKRPSTYPNLVLFATSAGHEKISVARCGSPAGSGEIRSADRLCAHLAIQNFGYGATDTAAEILISLDGSALETWVLSAGIRPGQVVERGDISFGPLAPGTHFLRVAIDPNNRIAETNEADNDATTSFVVSPRAADAGASRPPP
jgi:hypothetical protein